MKDQVTSIEQSRRLLELGIPAYLPYGLIGVDEHNRITKLGCYLSIGGSCRVYLPDLFAQFCKPYLRPMSDLTKEITHRGETFVPMVELARLHNSYMSQPYEIKTTYFDGLHKKGKWGEHELRYMEHTSNMGDLSLSFGYSEDMDRFYHRDETRRMPLGVANQLQMFDKLAEWMFDYRGLIPAGLAVDVNTLPENPYEV